MTTLPPPAVVAQVAPTAMDSNPPTAPYRRPVERLRDAVAAVLRVRADLQSALESGDSGVYPGSA